MNVRWRVGILAVQLAVLLIATHSVTGHLALEETWFFAGLLAIVVNPQLLEPWYPRPQDVLANSLIALFLVWTAEKSAVEGGWLLLQTFLVTIGIVALIALVLGAKRGEGLGTTAARAAAGVSRVGSAAVIYSGVFWLAAAEFRPQLDHGFWILGGAWLLLMLLGRVNWQAAWSTVTGMPHSCTPEGMIGPSTLLVSSPSLPLPGFKVRLRALRGPAIIGTVLTRIRRTGDVWGQVHLENAADCEDLVGRTSLAIEVLGSGEGETFAGAVGVGSTDRSLRFISVRSLRLGAVVCVAHGTSRILYQVAFAEVEEASARGGSQLVVRARAAQLGIYSAETRRIVRHPWVPSVGAAIHVLEGESNRPGPPVPDGWIQLGSLIGTQVPVFLDSEALCQGHVAILGMTRMGKTTLALRLARALAPTRRVTILDQTGEYIARQGLDRYDTAHDDLTSGISVFEPKTGGVPADEALKFLSRLVAKASAEYRAGAPRSRVLVIDEAHQFVPEPAGLGFKAPGRDSSYEFGVLMMQVRKFGIAIFLISQRTAVVAKSALSQCENLIAFKSVDQTGLDYLEAMLGENARSMLPILGHAQAFAFGPGVSSDTPVGVQMSP